MATIARRSIDMHNPHTHPRASTDSRASRTSFSSSHSHTKQSLGRGGAGNFGIPAPFDENLSTPSLKGENISTGRGGAGNMAHGLSADESRTLQDVEGQPPRRRESFHTGRGGAGNERRSNSRERRASVAERQQYLAEIRAEDERQKEQRKKERGLADVGKALLFGKKNKN